ncbi:hypothetical protein XF35_42295, partial [Streptomyces platensis subsp. clarensis]|nr:hypothetical protein [Streptomyces platensis subsp. clarensis]
ESAPIEVPGARFVRAEGPRQWLALPASSSAAPVVAAVAAAYPLVDLSVREPDIEAVIAKMYGGGYADGDGHGELRMRPRSH